MRLIFVRSLFIALVMAIALSAMSAQSFAQVRITVAFAPPELPVYDQPPCPVDGYLWSPGYWGWGDEDYYWVPGTWVEPPQVGFLWTPAYWGWGGDSFVFYDGYWGSQIGFYGGINYGFGYFGHGFEGGHWDHDHFFYNRAVVNVNVNVVHNVYNTTVVNENRTVTRVSFNGGTGGINERPTSQEEAATHDRHVGPVAAQTQQIQEARSNPQLKASANQGKPPIAATAKAGEFSGEGAVAAKEGGRYTPPPNRPANTAANTAANAAPRAENTAAKPATPVHPKDLPPTSRPAAPNTGNPKVDQKYQQQQQKLQQQQDQERQKLQQKQDQEHQRMDTQKASDAQKQQTEQRHQQQTQQLQQRHDQQQQQLQQRQAPPAARPAESKPH